MKKTVTAAKWDASTFVAPDGTRFPYSVWKNPKSEAAPRAVILAVHGLSGAASDWRPLGEHFQKRGIPVYAYELRGIGQ